MDIFWKASRTSNFVKHISVTEFVKTAFRNATKSNQPHLLGLPVVAPNSFPFFAKFLPLSSNNSVINGPSPTLVV